jgi:hypothetical protein
MLRTGVTAPVADGLSGWAVVTPLIPQTKTTKAAKYSRYFGPRMKNSSYFLACTTSIVPENYSIIEILILKLTAVFLGTLSDGKV